MSATEAQLRAIAKYSTKTYDRLKVNFRKDSEFNLDFIKNYSEMHGESVNAFIQRAITETIERDKNKE